MQVAGVIRLISAEARLRRRPQTVLFGPSNRHQTALLQLDRQQTAFLARRAGHQTAYLGMDRQQMALLTGVRYSVPSTASRH
jgi:hypothetical protein